METNTGRYIRAPQQNAYDLIIIGSGPGGQRAAVQAAKLGKTVFVAEGHRLGGSCLHRGTIPSKALREAALAATQVEGTSIFKPVMERTHRVIDEECLIIESQLLRNKIDFVSGFASFVDPHTVEVANDSGSFRVRGDKIIIATGTRPRRPDDLSFDGEVLFDSDTILSLETQPKTMLVLGAGVIGCEYASIFARMGVQVTLLESRMQLLSSIDPEIVEALLKQFEKSGVRVRLGAKFESISKVNGPAAEVKITDASGTSVERFDAILYCLGRTGNHESLNLAAVGLKVEERGTIAVNRDYQTAVPHIYAVGDIIGAPALAASSSEQGRLAALHAFTGAGAIFPDTFPYGIYTIPEISSVGFQEAQLANRGIKYVVGKARYSQLARGKMIGDEFGFLKLLVHAKTHRVVGIHVIGTSATELVHIGQMAIAFGASVEFFVDNVFNYPTLAEAYKVAAFNAVNKLKKL